MSADTTTSEITVTELAESLTGYEEIGIEQAFGADVADLRPTRQMRAMAFVHFKRLGQSHEEAKTSALSLPAQGLLDMFPDDPEEVMPEEPVTPVGKDASQPSSEPSNSPVSVS